MPTACPALPAVLASPCTTANRDDDPNGGNEADGAFERLRRALAEHIRQPEDAMAWSQFLAARQVACGLILKLPRKEPQGLRASEARQLVRELAASGVHDHPLRREDRELIQSAARKGWQGLLAAMLLAPAWQWPEAPLLLDVPDWLRTDYLAWLWAAPQGFCALGDAEAYAGHTLARLEELARWVARCPGAAAEAEVLDGFARQYSAIPLYFSTGSLRRHAELRGRLLRRALGQAEAPPAAPPVPRAGRRLRVGFVSRHFGPQTETFTTLPTFEQLDPERFEVTLFCHETGGSAVEAHCCQQAPGFVVLPGDLEGQLSVLRAAALDVAVFGTNVTAVTNGVLRLALHRVASLQVVNNSSCITSGLEHSDLYVSGDLTETGEAAAHFSERLGLLPGPAHAFNYLAAGPAPARTYQRSELGLPEGAIVFVSAANYFKIIPEMQHAWARLLAAVPGAHLLVHPFNPNWAPRYPIQRFRAGFERVLASHGVAASRLVLSTADLPARADVKALLGLGDVYLDSYPFGGVNSLVDPLELGLPVVAWEGGTMRARMGGALLRALDLPELIAASGEAYHALACRLAMDAAWRGEVAGRIRAKMERVPIFLDALAASEAFGDLIESAYDELVAVGRPAFRAAREPLRAASPPRADAGDPADAAWDRARATLRRSPADPAARQVMGRALLKNGRPGRATAYLLSVLQGEEAQADRWLDVARAFQADGQMQPAIAALEAGLGVDPQSLEGWLLYAELAQAIGSADIAQEAAGVARRLAPDDPRANAYLPVSVPQ